MKPRNFDTRLAEIIEGREKAGWLLPLLRLASLGYRAGISIRDFKNKVINPSSARVDAIVISVGNISVGGTGKTPVVQTLAKQLLTLGPVAILTRGYRSQVEKHNSFLRISWDKGMQATAAIAGDEAVLLSQTLPNCDVWIGKDRVANAHRAIAQGAKILILDDAMQYNKLAKDLEIAVVDSSDPLGRMIYLPEGPLRDHPERLRTADLIIVQRIDNEEQFISVETKLRPFTLAPIVGGKLRIDDTSLQGKKIGVFCAIGNPKRFIDTLMNLDCNIVHTWLLRDHSEFKVHDLIEFATQALALGAECIVCTEKDIVKIPSKVEITIPIHVLKIQWEPSIRTEAWENFINKVEDIHERRV